MNKHRRDLPHYIDLRVGDVQNDARCVAFGWSHCPSGLCPRHQPGAYAEHMASHAPDSIR